MSHLFYMKLVTTVVVVLGGLIGWATILGSSPLTDTVSMYTLQTDGPDYKALESAAGRAILGQLAADISLSAWYSINATCINTQKAHEMGLPGAPVRLPTTIPGILATPNLLTSPLCMCLVQVLGKFNAMSTAKPMDARVKQASTAFKACFSTNLHIPQQRQLLNENYKIDDIKTRKTFSKASLMLIICLSFLFNFIYSTMDYDMEKNHTSFYTAGNSARIAGLIFICILQMVLPMAFQSAAHTGNLVFISTFIVLPAALVQFGLMEVAWSYLRSHHREVHIHPYVFSTTLLCLLALAHFENGVFDFGVFLYYFFISHALCLAYAAALFFVHFRDSKANVDIHTLSGHTTLFAAVALLIISGLTPAYPTSAALNIAWVLPWVFTIIVLGLSIYVEDTFLLMKWQLISSKVSHMYFVAHALLVFTVIGIMGLKHWHFSFGESILPNADVALPVWTSVNMAFGRNPLLPNQYLIG